VFAPLSAVGIGLASRTLARFYLSNLVETSPYPTENVNTLLQRLRSR
jgi:hypothetical protein